MYSSRKSKPPLIMTSPISPPASACSCRALVKCMMKRKSLFACSSLLLLITISTFQINETFIRDLSQLIVCEFARHLNVAVALHPVVGHERAVQQSINTHTISVRIIMHAVLFIKIIVNPPTTRTDARCVVSHFGHRGVMHKALTHHFPPSPIQLNSRRTQYPRTIET